MLVLVPVIQIVPMRIDTMSTPYFVNASSHGRDSEAGFAYGRKERCRRIEAKPLGSALTILFNEATKNAMRSVENLVNISVIVLIG